MTRIDRLPPAAAGATIRARCVVTGDGAAPILAEVEFARPQGREVLVELRAAGICRTDLDAVHWPGRHILGHEGAGVVHAAGPDAVGLKPGDRVLLNWAIPCGHCRACKAGAPYLCAAEAEAVGAHPAAPPSPSRPLEGGKPIGRMFDLGTLADYALVDAAALTLLPETIGFAEACILGCAVMTGTGSVWNVAGVRPGDSVAVLGCGSVGLNAVQAARIAGAATIIAIDREQAALERAREFGATHAIVGDGGAERAAAEVARITSGGVDHAFEATGRPEFAFVPLALVRHGGYAVQMSGFDQSDRAADVPLGSFLWNKRYIVSLYGACVPDRDFPRLFSLHHAGRLRLAEQISRVWPFDRALEAMAAAEQGAGKQVVQFGAETAD